MTIDPNAIDPNAIEFREPPPPLRVKAAGSWKARAAEFTRAIAYRRGEWAVFRTGLNQGLAHAYASDYRKKFPHTEWVARREADGTYSLFARVLYV